MKSIKFDNDVFAHLQKHARPFVDTPNSTLRRLFGIDEITNTTNQRKSLTAAHVDLDDLLAESRLAAANSRTKVPKTDL